MAYHSIEHEPKPNSPGGKLIRVSLAVIILGGAGGAAMYRNSILNRFTKVFAAVDEDPIPVENSITKAAYP